MRDRNIIGTIRNHWPLFAALVYVIMPNIPGPIDDIMVAGIASCLELYFIYKRRQLSKDSEEYVEVVEIKRVPKKMIGNK